MQITKIHFATSAALVIANHVSMPNFWCEDLSQPNKKPNLTSWGNQIIWHKGWGHTPDELEACFVVRDHNGQQLPYVYFEDEPTLGGQAAHQR